MPAAPTINLTPSDVNGNIAIAITNSDSPNQGNRLYKQTPSLYGGAFVLFAQGIAVDGTFTDYNVASGLSYTYFAEAVDSGVAASSTTAAGMITLGSLYLHTTNKTGTMNNGSTLTLNNLIPVEITRARDAVEYLHTGREMPTVLTSTISERVWRFNVLISPADNTKLASLTVILDAKTTVVGRFQRNDILFGSLRALTFSYYHGHTLIPLILEETIFKEEIA